MTKYTNPISNTIRMGDPFVYSHKGRYYLTGTTGGGGFQAWTSTDFSHWDPIGLIYSISEESWGEQNYWAPEVLYYGGYFYMTYSANKKGGSYRLCLARSENPDGPFLDIYAPWIMETITAIDASIFVDDDGIPYVYYQSEIPDQKQHVAGIYCAQLSTDLSHIVGASQLCMSPSQEWELPEDSHWRDDEGPFTFKHAGVYYMTFSANHWASHHYAIGYATATNPMGPWNKSQENPIVSTDLQLPIAGPGHSCMVHSFDKSEMFMVYHCHNRCEEPMLGRVVNIDRVQFDGEGNLSLCGPTRSPQLAPVTAPHLCDPEIEMRIENKMQLNKVDLTEINRNDFAAHLQYNFSHLQSVGEGEAVTLSMPVKNYFTESIQIQMTYLNEVISKIVPAHTEEEIEMSVPQLQHRDGVSIECVVKMDGQTLFEKMGNICIGRWGNLGQQYQISTKSDVVQGQSIWNGAEDCSATFELRFEGQFLCLDVSVCDQSIKNDADSPWDNDSVELYLDVRPEHLLGHAAYDRGVFQITVVPRLGKEKDDTHIKMEKSFDGISSSSHVTENGYQLNIRIDTLSMSKKHYPIGIKFHADVGINDRDELGERCQLMWSGTNKNWGDARSFGRFMVDK